MEIEKLPSIQKMKPIHEKTLENEIYIINNRPSRVYIKRVHKLILKSNLKRTYQDYFEIVGCLY